MPRPETEKLLPEALISGTSSCAISYISDRKSRSPVAMLPESMTQRRTGIWLSLAALVASGLAGCIVERNRGRDSGGSGPSVVADRKFVVTGPARIELANSSGDSRVTAGPPGEVHSSRRISRQIPPVSRRRTPSQRYGREPSHFAGKQFHSHRRDQRTLRRRHRELHNQRSTRYGDSCDVWLRRHSGKRN